MAPTTISASPELGNAPAWTLCLPPSVPFPPKLCGMLQFAEQMGLDDVVSWLPHGRAFKIHDPDGFMTRVASRFLTATKLRSVHRQLLVWGFQRIDKGGEKDAWFHRSFVRGQPALMKNMIRTKIKGKVPPPSAMPNFLPFLDGTPERAQRPAAQPNRVSSISQESSPLSSRSFTGSSHQSAATYCHLSRSSSCPDRITEATSELIEPLPFRGNQDTAPLNDDESTRAIDGMIHDLFSRSCADGLYRGVATHCHLPRRASCHGGITEPTSQMIEPLPFREYHDKVPLDDGDVSLFIDQMNQEPYDEFSLFIDWTIYDPDA